MSLVAMASWDVVQALRKMAGWTQTHKELAQAGSLQCIRWLFSAVLNGRVFLDAAGPLLEAATASGDESMKAAAVPWWAGAALAAPFTA